MDDVTLSKVGEEQPKNLLPRGIHMVQVGDSIVFVRRHIGRLFPLPQTEQERLARDLGLINGC